MVTPDKSKADNIYCSLHEQKIEAKRYYNPPLHTQKTLVNNSVIGGELNVTVATAERILSLPVHDKMQDKDIKLIVETVKRAIL